MSRGKYIVELCKAKVSDNGEADKGHSNNIRGNYSHSEHFTRVKVKTSVIEGVSGPQNLISEEGVPQAPLILNKSSDKLFDILNLPIDFLSDKESSIIDNIILPESEFSAAVAENDSYSLPVIEIFDKKEFPGNTVQIIENSLPIALFPENEFPGSSSSQNNIRTSTNCKKKLVDYDSSTDTSEQDNIQKPQTKNIKLRKFNSTSTNYSNYNEDILDIGDEDSDFFLEEYETTPQTEELCVGDSGKRKPRVKSKKYIKKLQKNFGGGKTVQPNPCKNRKCQYNCAQKFTEQERFNIFEFYWGLGNYQRQRDWLLSCIKDAEIKRRRANVESSRRNRTFNYFIPWEEKEIQVCQQFLLKTLDISQMTVRYTKNCGVGLRAAKVDHRGKHEPPNKTHKQEIDFVHAFIKKLPAVPSHYCRNSTKKTYLPSELRNKSFLYRIYKEDQKTLGRKKIVSLQVFRRIFNKDFNMGFHLPKKDKCSICEPRKDAGFQSSENDDNLFQEHVKNKNACKDYFIKDQGKAKKVSTFVCASFDLQKVLNTPHGDNMLLYYSRKYAYYNETVYESGNRNAFCFLWGEQDGKRGCNEIGTVISKYLQELDGRGGITEVALYCDSCTGQNKNKAMISMIYNFVNLSENIKTIKIVYLLPGHTFMPVDAVHASIERFIRKRIIWAPSAWPTMIENARVNPKPYKVIKLEYSDFRNWNMFGNKVLPMKLKKTKEGSKIEFSKIRIFKFQKGLFEIKVKYSYLEEDPELTIPMGQINKENFEPSQLYFNTLPIANLKYRDLKVLCEKKVIPERYTQEYLNIKHKSNVLDVLAETDEDDEIDENSF